MTVTLPQFPDGRLLTHSSEQAWKTCPRKYFLSYVRGLRTRYDSEPLRVGHMWHLGVELYEGGTPVDEAAQSIRDAYADADRPPYLEVEQWAVEQEIVVALVRGHHRRWQGDLILQTVAVEEAFDVPIVNPATGRETPTFRSAGKRDRIASLPDGSLALVERKTTGDSIEVGGDYWRRLLMDSQVSRYVLAARDAGFDVSKTVYDVVRKPQIRPKLISKSDRAMATGQGHYFGHELDATCPERETPALFGARLAADLAERPDFYFARMEVPRLESDLAEFRAEQWTIQRNIRQAELDYRDFGPAAFPRNTGACLSPYKCQFFGVCAGQTSLRPETDIPDGFRRAGVLHEELVARQQPEEQNHDADYHAAAAQ